MLNNREIASLVWLSILAGFVLWRREVRRGILDLVRVTLHWKILAPLAAFTAYVVGLVLLGSKVELWDTDLVAATTIWFIGNGLVLLFNSNSASEPDFFRRTALKAVEVTVFIEFFLNLFVFHVAIELALVPLLFVLVATSVVAGSDRQFAAVKRLLDGVLAVIGLALVVYVLYSLATDWGTVAKRETVAEVAAPVWLTLGVIPFIYGFGVMMTYESAFQRIDLATRDPHARRRVKLALVWTLNLNVRDAASFTGRWPKLAAESSAFRETTRTIRDFQATRREEARTIASEKVRLARFAGVQGDDADGRRLDQRQFKETRAALQLLATAQMGWFNNDGRYREDLLFVLESAFTRSGLADHGITMHVSEDGQKWWAWRRTITGWCFAIGASDPPPDQWLFDGAEPPNGYPREGSEWGARFGLDAANW